ncbi:putative adenosine kinase [Trypanosoma theileri]|uniref:Adenosine kinase n=1 Tax=Trypanosoma theileri TaxID=67003 RepID=A0A1X0PBE6_9TRYP|nr:putative adenosine kinase [Trypanosoma theileri]ORC93770.1 putative adenosine kinase [Trypanosoma theileri]
MAKTRTAMPQGRSVSAVFFGHPLLDMSALASEELLAHHGIREGSVDLATPEQLPIFTKLLDAKDTMYHPGGAAMNAARTMKWICPEMGVCCVGAMGCDQFQKLFTEALDTAGVQHLFEYHEDVPSGTCAALVVKKERAMLANLGAATRVSLAHMQSTDVADAIQMASIFYAEGFFLNTISSPDNILLVAEHAFREGKLFCFNLSAPYISSAFGDRLNLLLPYIDILFGCKDDFATFGTVMWGAEMAGDIRKTLLRTVRLLKRNASRPCLVVATCGGDATLVADDNGVVAYDVPHVEEAHIVDLTGAGDAFVGGFLAQYAQNPAIDACVAAGHAAASVVIRQWGVRLNGEPPVLRT